MTKTMHLLAGLSATLLVVAAGCGGGRPGLVPVSGVVTIDGQPVTAGQVSLMPKGKRSAIGRLDEKGRFTLSSYELGDGAPIGTHLVTVTAVEGVTERSNRWLAPKKYSNKLNANLWVTIEGPTDDLNIELTWEGSPHDGPFVEKF